ncbi:MAG: NHLP bacteriocin export ABC transporter permease/ATPase subunit [Oscillospiraceae bacterium]|jgi:NHLM bacteriocin system ABC transporter ATP-binding protein|nr:NHLP bacteriocin export ABC transporter permease/ATPase subunit [Oscillospiraceae bacterium]
MGWVDDQIKSRIKNDKESFENSMMDLSSVVLGKKAIAKNIKNERQTTTDAIGEILKYYKIKVSEIPKKLKEIDEQLDFALNPTGIMYRKVAFEDNWWKSAIGPMIGFTKKGNAVALLPYGISGYRFFNYETGEFVKINKLTNKMLSNEGICFYKPFPLKKISIKDLVTFTIKTLSIADLVMILFSTAAVTLLGMLSPLLTKLQYDKLIPSGKIKFILPIALILLGSAISSLLIRVAKDLIMNRIQTKMAIYVESATMSRIISLPASFFKDYSSGDLASRVSGVQQVCIQLADAFLTTGLSTLFSITYVTQMVSFAPAMVIPGLIIMIAQTAFTIIGTFLNLKNSRKSSTIGVKLSGILFSIFNGIQKIKLAGGERRAFSQWAENYKECAYFQYDPPFITKFFPILSNIADLIGSLVLYYFAGASKTSVANYSAFNMAYGQVNGAIMSLIGISTTFTTMKPLIEMIEPVLNSIPEVSIKKKIVTNISGSIEIQHVTFSYIKDGPKILDDMSFKILPGQYVAIVGKTGCGKSTLMRLLLGFEKPNLGSIYFDGTDMEKLDLRSLRQHIGVVMQNGKLFSGDIYSNIVISAPHLNLEEAWEAAKLAGIEKDIQDMPMGMNTLISEGQGGISGGQRQRLMIARAIAPKPKILMLDEATSALDNITQKQVSDSLESLKNTRIVIAHRLSTIKNCDRIIMLDKGRIIEDGSYKELTELEGSFAELVKRQQIDTKENKNDDDSEQQNKDETKNEEESNQNYEESSNEFKDSQEQPDEYHKKNSEEVNENETGNETSEENDENENEDSEGNYEDDEENLEENDEYENGNPEENYEDDEQQSYEDENYEDPLYTEENEEDNNEDNSLENNERNNNLKNVSGGSKKSKKENQDKKLDKDSEGENNENSKNEK